MDPALNALLRESGWLARLARALATDPHRAEEAVQETLVAALEHPGEARSVRGWLRAVLRSKLVSQRRAEVRREHRERVRGEAVRPPGPGDVHERLELQEIVVEAVRALEEPYRATIVARYLDELSPAEIARRDGVPVRTVHTRLTRGLARLRERLAGRLGPERMQAWMVWLGAPVARAGASTVGIATKPWIGGSLVNTTTKLALAAAGLAGLVWLAVGDEDGGTRRARLEPVAGSPGAPRGSASNVRAELDGTSELDAERKTEALAATGARVHVEPGSSPASAPTSTGEGELLVDVRRQSDGRPLERAVLAASLRGPAEVVLDPLARARTDARGAGVLRLPAGRVFLVSCEVTSDPWHPVQQVTVEVPALTAGERRSLAVALPDGFDRIFHGRVVAAEDGRALPEAVLQRHPVRGPAPEVDARGAFAVPYASWTPDELEVSCNGFASERVSMERVDQSASEPYVVALERAGAVEAHLARDVDPASTLLLRGRGTGGRAWEQAFDERRTAVLEALPVRQAFTVELRAGDRTIWRDPEPLVLSPGERRVLEIAPGAGCLLFGTLLDEDGSPVGDQGVVAFPASDREGFDEGGFLVIGDRSDPGMVQATLDGQGGYEFLALPEGRWWVGPAFDGALAAWAVGVVIGPGSHARRLDLVAERGRWIRGTVVGPDGEPVHSSLVTAQAGNARGQVQVFAPEGHFEVGPLRGGAYELRAMAQGAFGRVKPQVVEAGTDDVVLRLAGDGTQGTIAGRVVDVAGRGVQSHVHLLMPRRGSIGTGTTDEGTFFLTGIDPGEYSVTASMPDGRAVVVPVTMAQGEHREGLVLELAPGGRIAVTHGLEDSARVAIWLGEALAADSTVRPGQETFEVVPAGRVRVELYGGGRTLGEQTLVVRPGRVERADFR